MSTAKILAAIAAILALSGCGGAAASQPPAGTSSQAPAETATTPAETASQAPATEASTARATAAAATLTRRMKAAGLPITGVVVYNAGNDPNHLLGRQNGYSSKDAWVVPAAVTAGAGSPSDDPGGIQYGGGVEVFPSLAGAQSRLTELKGFRAPIGDGYDYLAGTAVLRLSNYLTPAQANRFRTAFEAAVRA